MGGLSSSSLQVRDRLLVELPVSCGFNASPLSAPLHLRISRLQNLNFCCQPQVFLSLLSSLEGIDADLLPPSPPLRPPRPRQSPEDSPLPVIQRHGLGLEGVTCARPTWGTLQLLLPLPITPGLPVSAIDLALLSQTRLPSSLPSHNWINQKHRRPHCILTRSDETIAHHLQPPNETNLDPHVTEHLYHKFLENS